MNKHTSVPQFTFSALPGRSLTQSCRFHHALEMAFHFTINLKTYSYGFRLSVYNFEVDFTCLSAFIVNNLHQKCCIMEPRSGNCYLSKQNQSHIIEASCSVIERLAVTDGSGPGAGAGEGRDAGLSQAIPQPLLCPSLSPFAASNSRFFFLYFALLISPSPNGNPIFLWQRKQTSTHFIW